MRDHFRRVAAGGTLDECSFVTEGSDAMTMTLEQFGIDSLSPAQRLELISLIWDSLPEDVSLSPPDWHLGELERRIAAADAHPEAVEPWETVLQRLSRKQ
jgi:putative addiction module component (TIGR02574 family)